MKAVQPMVAVAILNEEAKVGLLHAADEARLASLIHFAI
jgi:hypothetical protein